MNERKSRETGAGIARGFILPGAGLAAAVLLLLIFPDRQADAVSAARDYTIEMITVMPAVMVLMGLFQVFVPGDRIAKHLGQASGAKGILLALLLGTLPTGPLYVAFPLAAALLKKGARVANIIVFLSAWACIKLPQELVELQFLGLPFMATRLGLTVLSVILMGLLIEALSGRAESRGAGVAAKHHHQGDANR